MAKIGIDFGGKKRAATDNEVNEQEPHGKIEVVPEHIEVKPGGEHLEFNTVPEQKNLKVKHEASVITPEMHNELNAYISEEEVDLSEANQVVPDESILRVIPEFSIWYDSIDKRNVSVRNAYKLVDQLEESNPKVFHWVAEHENDFAEIWLGADFKETPLFETAIPNGNSKPNYLVKEPTGRIVPKIDSEVTDEDVSYLTEEEIKENWSYFFEQGLSVCVNKERAY
ncbi:hypothetical protein [Streptococcus uberis]|uniref:hypothetical protein n=1 Tax=Streptococcus uberis TaxID=1349 RepID=UPI001C97155D|nr:hypothetical protein [Streptococcus uberis]MBY4764970.1 hypothetical protein [Streptococcus uberis]